MPGVGGWRGPVVTIGMWGKPGEAEASMTLQQPETPCVLLGKVSLDHGTLAVAGFTGSWKWWGGGVCG